MSPHAKKRIVNVPLPAYAGDKVYEQVADKIFKPFVESFKPQMLFISVGFDAHWNDPITSLGLSTEGYFMLAKKVVTLAEEHCDGKIVFVLEGGYDPVNVANGAEATFDALTSLKRAEMTRAIRVRMRNQIANPVSKRYESGMDFRESYFIIAKLDFVVTTFSRSLWTTKVVTKDWSIDGTQTNSSAIFKTNGPARTAIHATKAV